MDQNEAPTPPDAPTGALSRRRFTLTSGAALLGGLLAVPGSLTGATAMKQTARGSDSRREVSGEFDLRITILGLCLCVRDFADQRMHVLMPSTGAHAHSPDGRVDQHLARLVYDRAYEMPGATQMENRPVFVPLENGALDLTSVQSRGGIDLSFPFEVVDLDPIVQERVNRSRLSLDTDGRVISRVSVGGGSITSLDAGGRWSFGESVPRHMAIAVDWTITGVSADALRPTLSGMNGRADRAVPALHPIDGSIHLHIYHTPADELPPFADRGDLPASGELAEHFGAYYGLYDNPQARPLPMYGVVPESISSSRIPALQAGYTRQRPTPASAIGLKITCIGASATVE